MKGDQSKTGTHFGKLGFILRNQMLFISPEQIIRLEARSNYTYVYFTDHAPILMAKVLRDYEKVLEPFGFIRTHKSHLVNSRYILEYDRNRRIIMTDSSAAEVARRRRRQVKESLLSTYHAA